MAQPPDINAEIETIERLGGLLRSYRRVACGTLHSGDTTVNSVRASRSLLRGAAVLTRFFTGTVQFAFVLDPKFDLI